MVIHLLTDIFYRLKIYCITQHQGMDIYLLPIYWKIVFTCFKADGIVVNPFKTNSRQNKWVDIYYFYKGGQRTSDLHLWFSSP